ncbi:MAG: hypothetical protein WAT93_10075 [Pontixanthobacter sp.]
MNWPTAVVIIIAIGMIGKVLQARYRAHAGIIADKQGNEQYIARTDNLDKREIEDLRERIKVLERIATDANSPQQREIQSISDEIEKLRDR